jgi:nucleoside-diphosphate-sugar epimerase
MKISILGSGWLGAKLPELFVKEGHSVHISTTSAKKLASLTSAQVSAYLIDIERLSDNIQDFLNAQIVIINITSKNSAAFKNLIREIEKSPVEKVLFVSSTSVYSPSHELCRESDALDSSSHPLLQREEMFTNNRHFQTTILRFAGLIGPKRHPGRFFRSGKKIRDPQARVNLIHLDDCLSIIHKIVEKQAWGQIFNACADAHPSKQEYYTKCALALGLTAPAFLTPEISSQKVVSNSKLKECLDYQFIYPDLERIRW